MHASGLTEIGDSLLVGKSRVRANTPFQYVKNLIAFVRRESFESVQGNSAISERLRKGQVKRRVNFEGFEIEFSASLNIAEFLLDGRY